MINLPQNIDYTQYYNTSGMATSKWGGKAWYFLFTCIMARYPVKIDERDSEHVYIKKHFKHLFCSLSVIMPCIFCRKSFEGFLKELPIDEYLVGRIELMYWLYLMKDKVNQKLILQEKEAYNERKKTLKSFYYNKRITETEYYTKINTCKKNSFKTTPTPPFKDVLDQYEAIRASCSNKSKTCALPELDPLFN